MEITSAADDLFIQQRREAFDWDKIKHPRGEGGKFTDGTGREYTKEDENSYVHHDKNNGVTSRVTRDKNGGWSAHHTDDVCGKAFHGNQTFKSAHEAASSRDTNGAKIDLKQHRDYLHTSSGQCAYDQDRPLDEQVDVAEKTHYPHGPRTHDDPMSDGPDGRWKGDDEPPANRDPDWLPQSHGDDETKEQNYGQPKARGKGRGKGQDHGFDPDMLSDPDEGDSDPFGDKYDSDYEGEQGERAQVIKNKRRKDDQTRHPSDYDHEQSGRGRAASAWRNRDGMEITSASDDIHFGRLSYTNGNRYVEQKTAAPKQKRQFPDWRRFADAGSDLYPNDGTNWDDPNSVAQHGHGGGGQKNNWGSSLDLGDSENAQNNRANDAYRMVDDQNQWHKGSSRRADTGGGQHGSPGSHQFSDESPELSQMLDQGPSGHGGGSFGPNFNPNGPSGEQLSFDQMGPMSHGQADPSDLFAELGGMQAPPPACPHCGTPMRDKKSASLHRCAGEDSNADGADPEDVRAENEDNSVGADDADTDGAEAQGDAGKQSRRRQAFNPNDPYNRAHKDDPDIKAQREEYEKNLSPGDKWDDFKQHMKSFFHDNGDGPKPMDAGGMAALLSAADGNCGLCKGDGNAPWGDSCPACDGSGSKTKESSRREAWIRRRANDIPSGHESDPTWSGGPGPNGEDGSPDPYGSDDDDDDDDDDDSSKKSSRRRTASRRFSAVDEGAALFL